MEEAAEVNDSLATILSNVRKFHVEGKYSDVKLQIGTEVFSCQRSLLAAVSEYFDVMFSSSGFEESNIPGDEPIILNEMDATTFNEILGFIYTGEVCVNDSNVYPLLFLNDFLQLRTTRIKQNCLKYLKSCSEKIGHMSNAFHLFCFAKKKEENVIVDILSDHICRHLYHYSMDAQLVEIDFESLNALLKFGKNYILPLPGSHNVILKIIHTWVNHNREEKKKYRRELMENINFSNISSEYALLIIDKLEDVADKVANFKKDTTGSAFSELETLGTGVEIDLTDEDTRHTATIEFKVENFSVLKMDKMLYSSPKRISNLLWRMGVRRDDSNLSSYLEVALFCSSNMAKSTEWNCFANSTITIMAFKEPTESYSKELGCANFMPSLPHNNWCLSKFIKWSDLIDPKNGYIQHNTMVLRADVCTEVPVRPVPEAKA